MAGGISAPFIRYPIATSLLMVGVLFVGIVAYPKLPVAPLPQVDFPTIQVSAQLPGASPRDDGLLGGAAARDAIRADSRRLGNDLDQARSARPRSPSSSISTAISTARRATCRRRSTRPSGQLPKNLPTPPTYRKVNPADSPILCLPRRPTSLPLTEVDDNVETKLAQQISQIPGVAQVTIGGQQKPAIRVQLDPAKLVAKGLSLEDVRTPLSVTTVDNPKGHDLQRQTRLHDLHQRPIDPGQGLERRHRRLPQWRAVAGARHRPGRDGPQDTTQAAWADGKRGVFLVIYKQPGANVIDTVDNIMAELPRSRRRCRHRSTSSP